MRKSISIMAAVLAFAGFASANSQVYTFNVTNSVAMTNTVSLSGWLDKVEVSSPLVSAGSYAVVYASYDSGNTAIDTYCTLTGKQTTPTVVRPRVCGTSNAGTSLASSTNVLSGILSATYDRHLVGGSQKIVVTPTSCSNGGTVKVEIFYTTDKSPIVP
jgi:hypothetical protein